MRPKPTTQATQATQLKPKVDVSVKAICTILGGPFDWCEVPAGQFIYGDDEIKNVAGRQTLILPAFAMAKYPITYRQFQAFIHANDGFCDPRWWDGLAATPEHRSRPAAQIFQFDHHPRECVSWYDAMAFVRWLSYRLGGGYAIDDIDAWAVRLPTEAEWEKGARGTDGRLFPWGNQFDAQYCNTWESGVRPTTPVTRYPKGESPYGVMDMTGNVWEWCVTDLNYPRLTAKMEKLHTDTERVLRGGSSNTLHTNARSVVRGKSNPDNRNANNGFRIVRVP